MVTSKEPAKMTGRTKLALWLLIAPTGLLFATFILFAISNIALSTGHYYDNTGLLRAFINIILYLLGLVGFLAWLPGLITGIVLLATPPAKK